MISSSFYVLKYTIPLKLKKKNISVDEKQNKIVFAVATLFLLCVLIFHSKQAANINKNGSIIDPIIPKDTIEYVKSANAKRLFNDYNAGGPLIYNGVDVFVDGRADIYTGTPLKNYQSLKHCENNNPDELKNETFMEDLIDMYDFDAYFVQKETPIYTYLSHFPDKYKLTFEDDTYAYFDVK